MGLVPHELDLDALVHHFVHLDESIHSNIFKNMKKEAEIIEV